MNTRTTQNMNHCLQSEAILQMDSRIEKLTSQIRLVATRFAQYQADKRAQTKLAGMTDKQLRDIGLDDPKAQMRWLGTHLNTISLRSGFDKNHALR